MMELKTLQIGLGWFPERAGGLDRFYYDCTRYLPQVGVEMQGLVAGSAQVAQDSDGQVCSFAPHEASLLHRWQGLRRSLHAALRAENYDLIASHFSLYTFPVLDQIAKKPLVVHFHGPWAMESGVENSAGTRLKLFLEQIVYRRAVRLIVLSKAFGEILHRQYGVPWERIHVIPGGVDSDRFNPPLSRSQARSQLGWEGDSTTEHRPILVTVRRLANRMGLENLVTAIAQVRQQYPDILLHIIGKGSLQPTLQAQIEALDLTNHVRLLGFVPDDQLGLIYRAADLSVVPTVALEGFGLIILESLAAGTPVLGTPVGGIPEILQPFSSDLLFEGSAPEQLAQGIRESLSGQRHLPDAIACQSYVQTHYDWMAIAQQIKAVYESAV
jgi:glycosyltransferase involved in cell wall biosynthesis